MNFKNSQDPAYESVLILDFTKNNKVGKVFRQSLHTDVEILLINSSPPSIPLPGRQGEDKPFNSWEMLGIHVDRIVGIQASTTRHLKICSSQHNLLCISLSSEENKAVIDFMQEIRGLPYNHWDSILSRSNALIPFGLMTDIVIDDACSLRQSIHCLHPAQLVVLIFRQCLDEKRTAVAKLWGFNSRFTTANDIFEELRMTCIAIDADALSRNVLRALFENSSSNGVRSCITEI